MVNASAAQVLKIGNVDLNFGFGHVQSLSRVHHVPEIHWNIISGSCLVKNGFELSLQCNEVVITQTGVFLIEYNYIYILYDFISIFNYIFCTDLDIYLIDFIFFYCRE